MEIEHVTIAEEMEVDNAPIFEQVTKDFSEIEQVNHETFKALTKTLKQLFEQGSNAICKHHTSKWCHILRVKLMIQMTNIHKDFWDNEVLKGVDFTLKPGTVHALMGENGAGKSTLMKILVGIHKKTKVFITNSDIEIDYNNPKEAEEKGLTFIHQELNLYPELTVLDNLFVGKEIRNKIGILNKKK